MDIHEFWMRLRRLRSLLQVRSQPIVIKHRFLWWTWEEKLYTKSIIYTLGSLDSVETLINAIADENGYSYPEQEEYLKKYLVG